MRGYFFISASLRLAPKWSLPRTRPASRGTNWKSAFHRLAGSLAQKVKPFHDLMLCVPAVILPLRLHNGCSFLFFKMTTIPLQAKSCHFSHCFNDALTSNQGSLRDWWLLRVPMRPFGHSFHQSFPLELPLWWSYPPGVTALLGPSRVPSVLFFFSSCVSHPPDRFSILSSPTSPFFPPTAQSRGPPPPFRSPLFSVKK